MLDFLILVMTYYSSNIPLDFVQCAKYIDTFKKISNICSQNINKGFLISNYNELDCDSLALLLHENIEYISNNSLIEKLIDFTPYFLKVKHDYENGILKKHYIPSKIIDTDYYLENKTIYLKDYVDEFLENDNDVLLIFGEFGYGKTSFCCDYIYKQIEKYQNGNSNYLPIIIFLRDYNKVMNLDEMITNYFINECGIVNANIKTFKELMKYKNILLIFDGFDEVAKRVDYDTKLRIYNEIVSYHNKNTKIIITCRPNYFLDIEEYEKIFKTKISYYEPISRVFVDVDEVNIAPFDQNDILQFARTYEDKIHQSNLSIVDFINLLNNIHDLKDLASRPVLLTMIINSLDGLLNKKENTSINSAELYDVYTSEWLNREDSKGKTLIRSKDKKYFCETLAYKMFKEGIFEISYRDFSLEIKDYFSELTNITEIDYFSHDIRNCSFLNTSGNGMFSFVHNSFMEYFIATYLVDEIIKLHNKSKKEKADRINELLMNNYLTSEISLFMSDIVEKDNAIYKGFETLFLDVLDELDDVSLKNIAAIFSKTKSIYLNTILNNIHDFKNIDLSYSILENLDFSNKNLYNASFYNSQLRNVSFKKSKLLSSNLRNSNYTNCNFNHVFLENASLNNSKFYDCPFRYSDLAECNITDTNFLRCDFLNADISCTDMSEKTSFEECTNVETCVGLPYDFYGF